MEEAFQALFRATTSGRRGGGTPEGTELVCRQGRTWPPGKGLMGVTGLSGLKQTETRAVASAVSEFVNCQRRDSS